MDASEGTEVDRRIGLPVAAIAVVTVLAIVPVLGDHPLTRSAGLLVVAIAAVGAYMVRSVPVVRASVVLGSLMALFLLANSIGVPPAVVTVLSGAIPLGVLAYLNRYAWLRPAMPWMQRGRASRGMLAFGLLTIVLAGLALVLWTLIVDPDAPAYLGDLQERPVWVGIAGIIAFALVNPIWEEVIFRGVVQHELSEAWNVRAAIVVQAVLFGAAHWAGFPSGWSGSVMAAGWGCALGIIRVRTRGMLLPYVVHAGADATIGSLALFLL